MTQIDPRRPAITPSPNPGEPQQKQDPPFNWRVSVAMAVGLLILFGVLFGLRALDIFPPKPAEDPQIAAVRATLAAIPAQQAAPLAEPTLAPSPAPAPAPLGPIAVSTPAATGAAPALATVASAPTTAPPPAQAQQSATKAQEPSATGTQFETNPTPVATSALVVPTAGAANTVTAAETSPTTVAVSGSAQPTPVAINLPADLANAILQGYTNYWTVRVNAMSNPQDASIDLGSVMAGSELVGAQQTIDQYRNANQAFESDVKHTIWITNATADNAVIVDQFTATTVRVDPDTKAPLDDSPSVESRTDTFELQHLDGTWKVVDEP